MTEQRSSRLRTSTARIPASGSRCTHPARRVLGPLRDLSPAGTDASDPVVAVDRQGNATLAPLTSTPSGVETRFRSAGGDWGAVNGPLSVPSASDVSLAVGDNARGGRGLVGAPRRDGPADAGRRACAGGSELRRDAAAVGQRRQHAVPGHARRNGRGGRRRRDLDAAHDGRQLHRRDGDEGGRRRELRPRQRRSAVGDERLLALPTARSK